MSTLFSFYNDAKPYLPPGEPTAGEKKGGQEIELIMRTLAKKSLVTQEVTMRTKSSVFSIVWIFLFVLLTFLCATGGAMAADKPEKLVYGCIPDMTGPYAPIVGPAYAAFMDAAQYVNENGGIRGVPIEVVVLDCGGKVDVGVNNYMQMREMKPRPSMIYGIISGVGEALKERFNEDQIPAMWVCSTEVVYPAMYTFGAYPTYADLCGLFIDWLAETWKEKRPPKLAFLTWDTTYGKAVLYDEVYDYAKSKGVEIVAKELFGVRDVDVTNQMMRIRAKQADWIFTNTAGSGPVRVAKAARDMGYKVGIAGSIGLDDSSLYINREVFEGAVTIHPFVNWSEADNQAIKLMNKYIEMNKRKPTYRTIMYPMGFSGILVFKEVVERIVDRQGWSAVTGPMIKKEMEAMQNFSANGIATYSYTPDRHSPNVARVLQVQEGKWVPISDYRNCPDLRPAEYRP
jgi:branched-chain amino acid transport system substrate-binding protein